MANSAGTVGGGNGGQTDQGRGNTYIGSYSKSSRKTGKVPGAGPMSKPNSNTDDGNKRVTRDPRLG